MRAEFTIGKSEVTNEQSTFLELDPAAPEVGDQRIVVSNQSDDIDYPRPLEEEPGVKANSLPSPSGRGAGGEGNLPAPSSPLPALDTPLPPGEGPGATANSLPSPAAGEGSGVRAAPSFEIVLEHGRAERQYWRDLWRYRELFYILAWRDISVRYKQTVIGVAWALLQPLMTMLIMTIVFGTVAKLPSEGAAPYALMVFAAMLPWQFFSTPFPRPARAW